MLRADLLSPVELPDSPPAIAAGLGRPRISVVTVAYNAEATIGRTISSLLDQRFEDFEQLVIDGGSNDRTVEIVRSFDDPRIRLWSEPDRGIFDAMNKGLDRFRGDAVGFLNADDCFHDASVLGDLADELERSDVVHGHLDFVSCGSVVRRWRASAYRPGAFRRGWMPAHPTVYMRRWVVEATGRFDHEMRIGGDYDYMLRAIECRQVQVGLVDRVLVDMSLGGASTAGVGAYVRGNLEALRSRRRWLGSGPIDFALIAKPAGKILQWV